MDLETLRNEILTRTDDSSLDDTKMDRWINQGIKQWANRADWPYMITIYNTDTTTASTAEYSLQSDFKKMLSLRVGSSAAATETSADEYSYVDYEAKNVDTTGNYFYLNPTNDKYGLIPTPSTTGLPIFQKYYQVPDDLTATTSEPPFPENYHELCVFFALKKYWETSDEFQKVLFYDTEYENTIERMKADLLVRATGDLPRMKDIREFADLEHPQKLNSVQLGK